MITKAQVKHIQSLDDKKYRYEQGQFVVEGDKMIHELLESDLNILEVYALQEWLDINTALLSEIKVIPVMPFELEKMSSLTTPNKALAIVELPVSIPVKSALAILLDGIQDPGNLGSIIRIADWYNINTVYCSETCADAFNSKVIQASMGSIFRIRVEKCNLKKLMSEKKDIPVYACMLDGQDVNTFSKIDKGYLLIGNESKGVSEDLAMLSQHKVSIIRKGKAESLNAAVATGIICHCLLS
jgi:TrmH family RNA methyltransferase